MATRFVFVREHYAAIYASMANFRNGALLATLSPQFITRLDARYISDLGIEANTLDLLLGPREREHLAEGGSTMRPEKVLVVDLLEASSSVAYVGRRRRRSDELDIYGELGRWTYLHIGIKHVPAGRPSNSGKDELWMSTARKIRLAEIDKLVRKGRVRRV